MPSWQAVVQFITTAGCILTVWLSAQTNSMLVDDLFIMPYFLEMIKLIYTSAIVHFGFSLTMQYTMTWWENTWACKVYGWSVVLLVCIYDVVHNKLSIIATNRLKFVDQDFITGSHEELNRFAECVQYIVELKENTTDDGSNPYWKARIIIRKIGCKGME